MVRIPIGFVTISFFIINCAGDDTIEWNASTFPDISGTGWEVTGDKGLVDFMLFDKLPARNYWMNPNIESHEYRDVKGSFTSYSHFLSDYQSGNYQVIGDTLFVTVIGLESELPGTTKMEVKAYEKWVFEGDRLRLVYVITKYEQVWRVGELNPSRTGLRKRDSW